MSSDLKSPRKRTKAKPIVTPRVNAKKTDDSEGENDKGGSSRKGLFSLRSRGNRQKNEPQRIGELPNKKKLQAQAEVQPLDHTDIVQTGGQAMVVSGTNSSSTITSAKKSDNNNNKAATTAALPESPSKASNNSSFSNSKLSLTSPSMQRSFGGGLSFGNFFGGSSRHILEPQLLDHDDDGASVSSDPLSRSSSSLNKQPSAFESMFPGAPGIPTTTAPTTNPPRLLSQVSLTSASTGTASMGIQKSAAQFDGDLNWIPIVRQTGGLGASPYTDDVGQSDNRSVSSDQSEMRGPQARKRRDKKQKQKGVPTKEELVAAEMAAQMAALRESAEAMIKRAQHAEAPLPAESEHDATTAKLQKETSEWHEATGPAERKHANQHLKERDNIESEPVRKRRDKRSKRDARNQTKTSPQILPAPEPLPLEAELDLSSNSMPSLSNYSVKSENSMAADAFSKQYVVATTTDVKPHTKEDPNSTSKRGRRRKQPEPLIVPSQMDESSHVTDLEMSGEEPLPTNGPEWLAVRQPTNVYRGPSGPDELEPNASAESKSPRKKGTATGKGRLGETLVSGKFETLSASIASGDTSLGGSSHMIEDPIVPYAASSVLRYPRPGDEDIEASSLDDGISKPRSMRHQERDNAEENRESVSSVDEKSQNIAMEDVLEDSTSWQVEEDPGMNTIRSNMKPYISNEDEGDENLESKKSDRATTSSPKRRRSRRKGAAAASRVKTVEDAEELPEEELTTEKEWHSTWTRTPTQDRNTYTEKEKSPRRSKSPKSKKSSKLSKKLNLQNEKEIGESSVPMESVQSWHRVPIRPQINESESEDDGKENSTSKGDGKSSKIRNRKDRKKTHDSKIASPKGVSKRARSRRERSKSSDQNDGESKASKSVKNQKVNDDEQIQNVDLREGQAFHPVTLTAGGVEDKGEYQQETLPLTFLDQAPKENIDGDEEEDQGIEGLVAMEAFDAEHPFYSIRPQTSISGNDVLDEPLLSVASTIEKEMPPISSGSNSPEGDEASQASDESSGKVDMAKDNPEWHDIKIKPMVNGVENSHLVDEGQQTSTATENQEKEQISYQGINENAARVYSDVEILDGEKSPIVPFETTIPAPSTYPFQSGDDRDVDKSDQLVPPNEAKVLEEEAPEELCCVTEAVEAATAPEIATNRTIGVEGVYSDGTIKFDDAGHPEAMPEIAFEDSDSDDSSCLNAGLLGLENAPQGAAPPPTSETATPQISNAKNFFGDEVPETTNFFGEKVDQEMQDMQKVRQGLSLVRPPRPPTDDKPSTSDGVIPELTSPPPKPRKRLSLASPIPNSPSDDLTIQSVDRDLGNASRSKKLRQKVNSRRETLSSMLEASKNNSLSVENELLDLKRKLAISQALVQDLEIENDQIRRQGILETAKIQAVLLERLHKRETELENQVKDVMKQRNSAVQENHGLRMIIMGSCVVCRKRIPEKEFVMDFSVRDTILERRAPRSSFAWITGNLLSEAQVSMEESQASLSVGKSNKIACNKHLNASENNGHDSVENASLATTLPDTGSVFTSNVPVFSEAPLHWLSEKLFQKNERQDKIKQVDDLPLIEEVITYKRISNKARVRKDAVGDEIFPNASAENTKAIPSSTTLTSKAKKKTSKKKKSDDDALDELSSSGSSLELDDNDSNEDDAKGKDRKKKKTKNKLDHEALHESSSGSSTEVDENGGRKKKKSKKKLVREGHSTASAGPDAGESFDESHNRYDASHTKPEAAESFSDNQLVKDPWAVPTEEPGSGGREASHRAEKQRIAKAPVSETSNGGKKKSSFFGSLMGEQVLDDFSSFGFQPSNPAEKVEAKKKKTSKFSFFGSLMAEQVDDDAPFITAKSSSKTPSIPEEGTAEKPNSGTSRIRALLKEERVEDDMLVLDKVVSGGGNQASRSPGPAGRRAFGLKDEQANDDFPTIVSDSLPKEPPPTTENGAGGVSSPEKMTFLGWSRERLNRERVEDDMSFLKSPQVSPTRGIIGKSLGVNAKNPGASSNEMSPTSRALSSNSEPGFSSPFSKKGTVSPRRKRSGTNRGRRGSTRESPVPTYLNKFRSSVVADSTIGEGIAVSMADAHDSSGNGSLDDGISCLPDGHSPLGKRASAIGFGSLDADLLGSRPWRSDTGVRKLTSKLAVPVEGERESPFDLDSDDESTGEYDPLRAARALQDNPLGALDAIGNQRPKKHSLGLGDDPLSALDALPGNPDSQNELGGLDEDPLRYLDALGGENSYSPGEGSDGELGAIARLPL